ncbi:hypothetical protein SLEP1_g14378 [Rubroshorea leprosula]|uniref:Uncharacterized protein n=1 Tax=Rubroshorea leprosula TaxID=152421 RepID=A0AAV5IIW1_9ROSI|nr:hypothetical protein SLEP1_g14378 [Rubroshorea leprosula]
MVPVAVFRAKKVDSDAFKEAKDVGQVSLKLKFVKKMDEPIKNASSYEVVDIGFRLRVMGIPLELLQLLHIRSLVLVLTLFLALDMQFCLVCPKNLLKVALILFQLL